MIRKTHGFGRVPGRAWPVLMALALLAATVVAGCRREQKPQTAPEPPMKIARYQYPVSVELPENEKQQLAEQYGIQLMSLRLTSAGFMLDFRYKVLDPQKAAPVFNREQKPYIIDEASGMKTVVPSPATIGPLRQTTKKPVKDKIYFVLFANPGNSIKSGDKVSIVIGNFKAEHVVVTN
jgi:hypothetical protein